MRYYKAEDGINIERFAAGDMDAARRITRGLWADAEPGTYDVTIHEYDDEDGEEKDLSWITVKAEG